MSTAVAGAGKTSLRRRQPSAAIPTCSLFVHVREVLLGEIDWVVERDSKYRTYSCNYGRTSTKRSETDRELIIRDRRTGKELHRKLFKAPKGRCDRKIKVTVNTADESVVGVGSGSSRMSTRPSDKAIARWLEGFVK